MKSNLKRAGGKNKAVVSLCVLLAVTILLGIVGFTGLSFLNVPRWLPTANSDNWPDSLPLGLDLQGGVYVEYTGKVPEGSDKTFEDLVDGTISKIRTRLTEAGQTEANIQRIGTNGIRVEIPIKRTDSAAVKTEAAEQKTPATFTDLVTMNSDADTGTDAAEGKLEDEGADAAPAESEGNAEGEAADKAASGETAAESETAEGETADAAADGEPAKGETAEAAAEGETAEAAAEGETAEAAAEEPAEGETAEAAAAAEEPAEGETADSEHTDDDGHDHSETAETTESAAAADPDHEGMKTLDEEMKEDGYMLATDGYGNYGYVPVEEDGSISTGIDFSENDAIKKVLDLIGKRAVMRFVDADGYVFMKGDMVETARYVSVTSQNSTNPNQVEFTLTKEGKEIFGKFTKKYRGDYIDIWLDNERLVHAVVNDAILDGTGLISGSYTQEEATAVAAKIQSGALPLELTQDKVDMVSATLGQDALSSSVTAAFIGILLIMALMIFRYRLNGVVASWALTIYVIVLFALIALFKVQLTLPGLAGIVLGIGMAVDANVIIFERFNEEARKGRSAKASVRAGFKNALSAILDANVTTLIAAVVLMIAGTGSIRGFAYTLLLGVVVSMFTAILVTRFLMNRFVDAGCTEIRLFAKVKAEEEVEQ